MPYRRLPNTDQARIRAIRGAINKAEKAAFNEQVLQAHTLYEARNFINVFEASVNQYLQNTNSKIVANKEYKHLVNNARMYLSHFIQTLNMAITRGDIPAEVRKLYGLPVDSNRVPDLTLDDDIMFWGQKIVAGELARTNNGMNGYRLQNPPITIVSVHFDRFREAFPLHNIRKTSFTRTIDEITDIRVKADALILDIWNQVEDYYRDCRPYDRLCKCQAYGLIYYYRTGEKRLSEETDRALEETIENSPTINFNVYQEAE